ncbi:MAG TPA: hypothetical protein PLL66_05795, partial [Bacteroidales bacterium]|nr:hypothetical protein [Bacteroidales bacterium]
MNFKSLYLIIILILFSYLTSAQIIGGPEYEKSYDMISDSAGNLYLTGFSGSYNKGNKEAYIIKYNTHENSFSYKTWGKGLQDEFRTVSLTNDGFIFSGSSMWMEDKAIQAVLAKYNSELEQEWINDYGNNHFQHFYTALVHSNRQIYAAGNDRRNTWPSLYFICTESNGKLVWERICSDYISAFIVDLIEKENGNIVALCSQGGFFNLGSQWHSHKFSNANILFIEIDKNGEIVYNYIIHKRHHDIPIKIMHANKGNFYLLSHSQSYREGNGFDICLSLLDPEFKTIWVKCYGGLKFEYAADMEIDADGNIHIVGTSGSANEDFPVIFYLKTDPKGNLLEKEYLLDKYRGYGSSIEIIDTNIYISGTITLDGDDDFVLLKNKSLANNDVKIENTVFYDSLTEKRISLFNRQIFLNSDSLEVIIMDSNAKQIENYYVEKVENDDYLSLNLDTYTAGI